MSCVRSSHQPIFLSSQQATTILLPARRVKGLCTCQVMLEHGEALMTHISHVIGAIVRERQTMSVNDEEIASLCAALEKEAEPDRLAALQPKLTAHHFTTSQVRCGAARCSAVRCRVAACRRAPPCGRLPWRLGFSVKTSALQVRL